VFLLQLSEALRGNHNGALTSSVCCCLSFLLQLSEALHGKRSLEPNVALVPLLVPVLPVAAFRYSY
jgi:hypothetical protein